MIRLGALSRVRDEHLEYCARTGRDERGWTHTERLRAAFMWNVERVGLSPQHIEFWRYLIKTGRTGG